MYTNFFGLNEKPFSITPDPRYLFMSERHGEALAHLVYGVTESCGFVQLTGEVGTGKTTLVRTLLQNRLPDNADVAVILNPQLTALEFLQTICEELGVGDRSDNGDTVIAPDSSKALIDALNHYLLMAHADGRRTILVVDEAQNLARDVLEQVRLLTNLETSKQKLLQIILIGQPELRELLARNDLRQLAQRITGRYHLEPLSRDETAEYIEHRLQVAGALSEVFDNGAKRATFKFSKGVPRLINVICDRALLGAYSRESRRVDRRFVARAAAEISGKSLAWPWLRWAPPALIATGAAIVAFGAWSIFTQQQGTQQQNESAATVPSATIVAQTAAIGAQVDASASEILPLAESGATGVADEKEASLDEQLLLANDLTNVAAAFATLFELWGLSYDGNDAGCDQAQRAGFECLSQRGSWNSLRQLDRPAILNLTDSRGFTHRAVLTAIQGDRAELSIAGVKVSHPIEQVSELWFGQYLLIWKPATGSSIAMGPGARSQNVLWLRQSLAAIDRRYRSEPLDSDYYDAGLEEQVRAFQRDHRLMVDGLAGRQTQIIINSLLAPDDIPRLTTPLLARD
ncbi:MAG: AAA family ATPase [Gammaproteobacteria bacterium]|nr:AAA family ATPase [Gammaproteobacteria bacterium]